MNMEHIHVRRFSHIVRSRDPSNFGEDLMSIGIESLPPLKGEIIAVDGQPMIVDEIINHYVDETPHPCGELRAGSRHVRLVMVRNARWDFAKEDLP